MTWPYVFVYGQTGTKFAKVSVALPVTLEFAKDGRIRSNDCSWIGVCWNQALDSFRTRAVRSPVRPKDRAAHGLLLGVQIYDIYILYTVYIYIMIWYDRFIVWSTFPSWWDWFLPYFAWLHPYMMGLLGRIFVVSGWTEVSTGKQHRIYLQYQDVQEVLIPSFINFQTKFRISWASQCSKS